MGKKIAFTTDDATGIVKGRKRLRGDSRQKPEVKKYNPFSLGNITKSITLFNCNWSNQLAGYNYPVFYPVALAYPSTGDLSNERVGNKIYLKYLRFQGYFQLYNYMVCPVRWRLCLLRVDFNSDVTVTVNQNWYLNHFLFVDTTAQTPSTSAIDCLSWSRHNFYKKVKDVNDKTYKRKVIASGFFPVVCDHKNYDGQFVGTMGNNPMSGTYESNGYNASHAEQIYGFAPLDVTVKLYDNIDCGRNLRRYYLVFETDNCIGYSTTLTPSVGNSAESTFILSCHCLAYFTDA